MLSLENKLSILGEGARYDVSCASSGSVRRPQAGLIGSTSTAIAGVCHSWSEDGRCVSLLKILMSNACVYDCAYCLNRSSADIPRASLTPEELAELTIEFYRRNYIEGLFLSSAVLMDPQYTTEQMIKALALLRHTYRFNGYIHVKAIPGVDPLLLQQLGLLADRMSVNIELPSESSLRLLAPEKEKRGILQPMANIRDLVNINKEERSRFRSAPLFAPAGQSTQMVVGASPETDRHILLLSQSLYRRYELRRVYYSAYVPVGNTSILPRDLPVPLTREHRLYQADWLVRLYGFSAEEVLDESYPHLEANIDPKAAWALRHLHLFPVEVNTADKATLLRVPGLGERSAQRIIQARRSKRLKPEDVKKMGMVIKRAQYFLTADGVFMGSIPLEHPELKLRLLDGPLEPQLSLLEDPAAPWIPQLPYFTKSLQPPEVVSEAGELAQVKKLATPPPAPWQDTVWQQVPPPAELPASLLPPASGKGG
ncbi:MAG: putative DNA modification/repair radical SAM protein [Symbiobacteriaceae bacterium]|nr:putative DNA modification/repair radical SAM protein [Symbiobacteriaceae bacterium]